MIRLFKTYITLKKPPIKNRFNLIRVEETTTSTLKTTVGENFTLLLPYIPGQDE